MVFRQSEAPAVGVGKKMTPATVILPLYGHSAQWGLVQPHSFAVYVSLSALG